MGYITQFELEILDAGYPESESDFAAKMEFQQLLDDARNHSSIKQDPEIYNPKYLARLEAAWEQVKKIPKLEDSEFYSVFTGKETYMKWYSHEDDMRRISECFPGFTFKLTGYGEERDDIWCYWYRRGRRTGGKAQIVFPEPDFNELLEVQ